MPIIQFFFSTFVGPLWKNKGTLRSLWVKNQQLLIYQLVYWNCCLCHQDDEEPKDEQFDVDGKYFPRVFFLSEFLVLMYYITVCFISTFTFLFAVVDHKGKVQKDLHNNDLEYIKYKFFYNDDEERK